ncbi:hypothetical protein ACWEOH_02270 [Agromyces sp. NPDC004153]
MPDPRSVVRAGDGVRTAADLRDAGFTRRAVEAAVASGAIERVRRGVFVDPGMPLDLKRAVRVGGRLACVSAARLHGLRVLTPPSHLHVEVDHHATRLRHADDADRMLRAGDPHGIRLHWTRETGAGAIVPLETSLRQMLACVPELDAICALDAAREWIEWRPGRPALLGEPAFERFTASLPPHLRRVAERSITGSQAIGETVARERLRAAGIPAQAQVRLPGGYWADLLIGERLIFDIDGETPHSLPGAFDRDRSRIGWLVAIGYEYVSFSHRQVLTRWDSIEAALRMLLRRGAHRWDGIGVRPVEYD